MNPSIHQSHPSIHQKFIYNWILGIYSLFSVIPVYLSHLQWALMLSPPRLRPLTAPTWPCSPTTASFRGWGVCTSPYLIRALPTRWSSWSPSTWAEPHEWALSTSPPLVRCLSCPSTASPISATPPSRPPSWRRSTSGGWPSSESWSISMPTVLSSHHSTRYSTSTLLSPLLRISFLLTRWVIRGHLTYLLPLVQRRRACRRALWRGLSVHPFGCSHPARLRWWRHGASERFLLRLVLQWGWKTTALRLQRPANAILVHSGQVSRVLGQLSPSQGDTLQQQSQAVGVPPRQISGRRGSWVDLVAGLPR